MVFPRVRSSRPQLPAKPIALSQSQEWADARSAGQLLGVSEKTLGRWRKAGLLKAGEWTGAANSRAAILRFCTTLSAATVR